MTKAYWRGGNYKRPRSWVRNVSDDPTVIRALAIHADDIVSALEANARRDVDTVLRVTPPFSGRMRARLHVAGREADYGDPAPLHIPPERFVIDPPPFPSPDDTEDVLRTREVYTPKRHRERHERAVEGWRRAVRDCIRTETTLETPDGEVQVSVATLG